MSLSKIKLPTSLDEFHSPKKADHGHSFSAKVNLDDPFFQDFSYKQLRKMVLELRWNISAYRVMAYFCKQGVDIKSYCRLETPNHLDDDHSEWLSERFDAWDPREEKLSELASTFNYGMSYYNCKAMLGSIPCINIEQFHKSAMLICEAMSAFGFIEMDNENFYQTTDEMISLVNQNSKPRITRAKAWLLVPELIKRANVYNATNPPTIIVGLFLFGSLSRDAETVDDIDISIQTARSTPTTGCYRKDYDLFIAACRDYVDAHDVTEYRNTIIDSPCSDVSRHLHKQFSRLNRIKTISISRESLSDSQSRFYCLFEKDGVKHPLPPHDGLVDIDRSIMEGRVIVKNSQ